MRTFNFVRLPLRAVAIAMAFSLAALSTAAVATDDGMKSSKAAKQADIVDTAVAAGQFKTYGSGPGGDTEGRWTLHRFRPDGRGVRGVAGWHRRQPAEA